MTEILKSEEITKEMALKELSYATILTQEEINEYLDIVSAINSGEYAINSIGISYGDQQFFTTLAISPMVTTNSVTLIGSTGATCGGEVIYDGGDTITSRGVCWANYYDPTIYNSKTIDGSGLGTFISNLTFLTKGIIYYVRAYATNSAGTSYGNQISFTSLSEPIITTNTITNISINSVVCGGNITSDGGTGVTSRGVCWSVIYLQT